MSNLKQKIIKEVFTWMPNGEWIFDFRNVSLTGDFLEVYTGIFYEKFKNLNNFQVCGLESASISLLSAIVLKSKNTSVNGFFIRKSRKKHDLFKQIEGQVLSNTPIVIIDDILNSGSSTLKQIIILKEAGHNPKMLFCILRFRDKEFYKFLTDEGIEIVSLFELNDFKDDLPVKNLVGKEDKFVPILNKQIWGKKFGDTAFQHVIFKSQPLLHENKLYFGTDSGIFYCVNSENGESIWTKKILFGDNKKMIFSSSAVHKDKIFFGAYDGNFYCLDKNTGKQIWVYMDADWIGSSPTINPNQNYVYIGLEYGLWKKRGGVAAINIDTGKEIWKDTHSGLTHCSPYYSEKNNLLFCGSNDGILRIYDGKTGEKLKEHNIGSDIKMTFTENQSSSKISFGAFDGLVYIINTKTLEIEDKAETLEAIYSNQNWEAENNNEYLYISSLDKNVYKYDIVNKKKIWTCRLGGRIFSTPVLKEDFIYGGCNDGKIYKIDKNTGEKCGYIQFTERVLNNIIFDAKNERRVFVPTQANEIYCLELE